MKYRDRTKNDEPSPHQDTNGELLTLSVRYGGVIEGTNYKGGSVYKFDYVNKKYFSLETFDTFAKYLGLGTVDERKIKQYLVQVGDEFQIVKDDKKLCSFCDTAVREVKELEIIVIDVDKVDVGVENEVGVDGDEEVVGLGDNDHESSASSEVESSSEEEEDSEKSKDEDYNPHGGEEAETESDVENDGTGESDIAESEDDFNSEKDSDSGNEGEGRLPVYNPRHRGGPEFELRMIFSNKWEVIDAIHHDAIVQKRNIRITKNDKERVHAKCNGVDCEWKLHANKLPGEDTFMIKYYVPTHTCPEVYHVKSVKSRWLNKMYGYTFKNDPKRKVSGWKEDLSYELGVNITHHQTYNTKRLALHEVEGDPDAQYNLLWDYAAEIRRSNPGSTVIIGTQGEGVACVFDRMYICLQALKEGFMLGCRPLIGVDGCHLKGPHGGIVLSAVGVDGNNNIFPIAYAVVKVENGDNWEWFLTVLRADLQIKDQSEWTFISDKQKGLIQAFESVFPQSSHRFCVRHLHGNMRNSGFRGHSYKIALYKAAKATTENRFNARMYELGELDKKAVEWLSDKPPAHWCRAWFNTNPKCDMVMNNICESFNASILHGREKPILSMLEWIMQYLMKRHRENRDRANRGRKWQGKLCPRIQKIINRNVKRIGTCMPVKASENHYQIRCIDGTQFAVDLENWKCGCRKWDLTGIPCIHAIRAIYCSGKNPEDFTDLCYKVDTYMRAYDDVVKPINGREEWIPTSICPMRPPVISRGVGRPPKARRRESDEPIVKQKKKRAGRSSANPFRARKFVAQGKCTKCGQPGHNRRACQNPPIDEEQVVVQQAVGGEGSDARVDPDVELFDTPVEFNSVNATDGVPIVVSQIESQVIDGDNSQDTTNVNNPSGTKRQNAKKAKRPLQRPYQAPVGDKAPPSMYEQLMGGEIPRNEDGHITMGGREYVTRSRLAESFAESLAKTKKKGKKPSK